LKKGRFTKNGESVRKTGWNIKLAPVGIREDNPVPPAEGWGSSPKVNNRVKNFTRKRLDQLSLRVGILKVQAAQRASARE
jgi:hypothetical protein